MPPMRPEQCQRLPVETKEGKIAVGMGKIELGIGIDRLYHVRPAWTLKACVQRVVGEPGRFFSKFKLCSIQRVRLHGLIVHLARPD